MPEVTYIVHDLPVGRTGENYLAMANLEPFGFGDSLEQIWLRPLADGSYEVTCVPFRVYGLALGDTVALNPDGTRVAEILKSSGHRVFRIFLPRALADSELKPARDAIVSAAAIDGLKSEWSGDRHVAIDVPPGRQVSAVWESIQPAISAQHAVWEWGDVEDFRV